MKYLLLILAVAFAITNNSYSQVSEEWVARYNGPGNGEDGTYSIAVDDSENVYITGYSIGIGTDYDYATLKYNSSGVQQWVQRYNGTGNSTDAANSIAVDGSGNVYVTGDSYESGTSEDYATIKYNSSGVQLWVQRYNGTGNDYDIASSLAVDNSGNVYVTGFSIGSGTNYDYATIKYNSSGVQQWVQRYNGSGNSFDYASSLAVDGSGNVYVTGKSTGSGTNYDYATIKYNSSGVQQWVQRYNGPGDSSDAANSLAIDGSGNVYVTGKSTGSGTNYDYATIKYNSSGVQQWVQRYNGPGGSHDGAISLKVDGSGNVYVCGYSYGSGTSADYATIKYNSSGVQQWVQRYNGPGNSFDYAYSIAVDGLGNVYVTGSSTGSGTNYDYATIKYSSSGIQQWIQRYNGPGDSVDSQSSIAVGGSGNVYVTGSSAGSGTGIDFTTIKYSQSVGIQYLSSEIPGDYSLSQNYPNPFNPKTVIRYSLIENRLINLKVYDVLGNEVATLVNEKQTAGTYSIEWDASSYSSGIYFYTLKTESFTETKKMSLIK